ncbi:MAG: FAD-binding oxidoreductase [Polyangiaceae bacterium]|nr:FAD-binding oxidoreductase [Polyangiaceae bacterium]
MSSRDLAAFLAEAAAIVGEHHVSADPAELERLSTATFATPGRVLGRVRPGSVAELRQLLRRATVPLYPVSGGKNWGLGSKAPPRDAVLLDLGRLNRIVAFDEELATVTVEPGVTFRQLYEFLRQRGSRLFAATTGGSPDGSVVANALERGDGSGPNGDRALHLAALEVVLPTGELVHTGFDRFENASCAALHRFGVGPALDGLFTQSNLGVVTRATIWLSPLPRFLGAVRFSIERDEQLGPLLDAIRRLRLDGTLRSAVGVWNDYRVLSVAERHPGPLPLSRQAVAQRVGQRWFGLASVYAGSRKLGEAAVDHVEAELRPHVSWLETRVASGDPRAGQELFPTDDPAFAFLQGVPHEQSLRSLYFRKPGALPSDLDPDRDRVGALWVCAALPLRGPVIARAAASIESVMHEHGFDPLLVLLCHTERTLQLLPMIVFDRDEPGADARALGCHEALVAGLALEGHLPQRLALPAMQSLPAPRDDFAAVLERLKRALDPAGVLAPGRYAPSWEPAEVTSTDRGSRSAAGSASGGR